MPTTTTTTMSHISIIIIVEVILHPNIAAVHPSLSLNSTMSQVLLEASAS